MMNIVIVSLLTLLQLTNGLSTVGTARYVNDLDTTWKATETPSAVNISTKLGSILSHEIGYVEPEIFKYTSKDVPEEFDVRTAFPECESVTSRVRDQSNCGSCWAFGATEAFNDRYCISTGDNTKVFSPTDTLACCSGFRCGFSKGCNGGQPSGAWSWFTTTGVVEGGDYGDDTTCMPYPFPSCAHHVESDDLPACDTLPTYDTPECTDECTYGNTVGSDSRFYAKTSYSLKGVNDIQQDIMNYGTVTTAFSVYEDFEVYSSGVYQHETGKYLGGHAVKMVGWGIDNGTPYWTCINSWNDEWGESGAFRILRGSDECGIESNIVAGTV